MWHVEVRNLVRRRPAPGALRGIAGRILADAGRAPGLLQLLAVYLGSRADLLPLEECTALLRTTSTVSPLLPDEVGRTLREQLGPVAEEIIETLEPLPRESDVLVQTHGAQTRRGERILIKVLRPDSRDRVREELPKIQAGIGHARFEREFRSFVHSRLDLAREAGALRMLADDGRDLEIMTSPRVLKRFCAPGVLVTEDCSATFAGEKCPGSEMYAAWIRQAAMGRVFLQEPSACCGPVRAGGPVIVMGSSPTQTSEASRRKLARYLLALCSDDPDRAANALLIQSEPRRDALREHEVRRRFRFSTPERESPLEWLDRPSSISQCITHWRILFLSGWDPGPALMAFLRGLTVLTVRTAHYADRDLLMESLEEIRPHLLVFQTRKILDGIQAGAGPGGGAALVRKIVERGSLGLAEAAHQTPSILGFGSRLLLFAAAGVLAPSIGNLSGGRGEALAALIVLVAGVSALAACGAWRVALGRLWAPWERVRAGISEDVHV